MLPGRRSHRMPQLTKMDRTRECKRIAFILEKCDHKKALGKSWREEKNQSEPREMLKKERVQGMRSRIVQEFDSVFRQQFLISRYREGLLLKDNRK